MKHKLSMRKIKYSSIVLVAFLCVFLNIAFASAMFFSENITKNNTISSGVLQGRATEFELFDIDDAQSQEIYDADLTFTNTGSLKLKYQIEFKESDNKSGDDLCGKLLLSAKRNGEMVYEKEKLEDFSMNKFDGENFILAVAEDDKWKFYLELPSDTKNGDEIISCEFYFKFDSWQEEFKNNGNGFTSEDVIGKNVIAMKKTESKKVVINEIMWMGSTVSSSDEWIELRNLSDDEVDIGGWEIENARSSGNNLKIPGGKSIKPFGYFLISNYSDESANSALRVETDEVNSSISLSNSGNGNLILRDEGGSIIDQALGNQWPVGENGDKKKSMERNDELGDGLDENNWHTCEGDVCVSEEYWDEMGDNFGTPGGKNSNE